VGKGAGYGNTVQGRGLGNIPRTKSERQKKRKNEVKWIGIKGEEGRRRGARVGTKKWNSPIRNVQAPLLGEKKGRQQK